MPSPEIIDILFQDNTNHTLAARLHGTRFDSRDRTKRALLKLGLFWLLAVASIPIIFAHWVLVPGFFLAGPWMAWRTYQLESILNHAEGDCPSCGNAIRIKLESGDQLPKWTYCPDCNAPLQIIPKAAKVAS